MPRSIRSAQATADLNTILENLDQRNPKAAERLASAFDQECELHALDPEMGRDRPDLAAGLRSFRIGVYVLIYRAVPDGIEVLRITHGRRDVHHPSIERLLDRYRRR